MHMSCNAVVTTLVCILSCTCSMGCTIQVQKSTTYYTWELLACACKVHHSHVNSNCALMVLQYKCTYMYLPVKVVKDGDKEVFIKFKGIGKLNCHLPYTVNKLQEYGCTLVITMVTVTMAESLDKDNKINVQCM